MRPAAFRRVARPLWRCLSWSDASDRVFEDGATQRLEHQRGSPAAHRHPNPRVGRFARPEPGRMRLTYSGSLDGQRYTPLAEINAKSASRSQIRCVHQFASGEARTGITAVVAGGTIFMRLRGMEGTSPSGYAEAFYRRNLLL